MTCSVDACARPVAARGWCGSHYKRWQRHGDPLGGSTAKGELREWLASHLGLRHPQDVCVLWPYGRSAGYGSLLLNGRQQYAHRIVCEAAHGPQPEDRPVVAHSCGVPRCVNPNHLRWANHAENTADSRDHGSMVVGEASHFSKFTADDVRTMRKMDEDGFGRHVIAKRFGTTPAYVGQVVRRGCWRAVA